LKGWDPYTEIAGTDGTGKAAGDQDVSKNVEPGKVLAINFIDLIRDSILPVNEFNLVTKPSL
jgi:hypothetical protein